MAGKDQHHVWRMLQRGFSFTDKGPDQIWVYSKNAPPEQTVTKLSGFERRFYGEPDSDADRNITDFENKNQGFIQDCRTLPNGTKLDAFVCAGLVAHLVMRSKFIRFETRRIAEYAFNILRQPYDSKAEFVRHLSGYLAANPGYIEEQLSEVAAPSDFKESFLKLAPQLLAKEMRNSFSEIGPAISGAISKAQESLPDLTRSAHIKSLVSDFTEVERAQNYRTLNFSIRETRDSGYILPDTCVAFFSANKCSPISQKGDVVDAVIVPIASGVAIVGRRDPNFERPDDVLNRALSGCSMECFIAQENTPEFRKLAGRISKNARMMTESDIRRTVRIDRLIENS